MLGLPQNCGHPKTIKNCHFMENIMMTIGIVGAHFWDMPIMPIWMIVHTNWLDLQQCWKVFNTTRKRGNNESLVYLREDLQNSAHLKVTNIFKKNNNSYKCIGRDGHMKDHAAYWTQCVPMTKPCPNNLYKDVHKFPEKKIRKVMLN